jgi:hypothetical protein
MSDPKKASGVAPEGHSRERHNTEDAEQFAQAIDAAVAAGQQIAKNFATLSRRPRPRVARLLPRQPPLREPKRQATRKH